jgi:hypothetical protein
MSGSMTNGPGAVVSRPAPSGARAAAGQLCTWVFGLGLLLGGWVLLTDLPDRMAQVRGGVLAALPVIVFFGLAVAVLIVVLDRSHASVYSAWAWAWLWGAVGAAGLALQVNSLAGTAVIR